MSTKPISTRTDEQTHSAVDQLSEDRGENMSGAAEEALQAGLKRLGYLDGGPTPARRLVEIVSTGVFHVGATLLAFSLFGSAAFFASGMGVMAASLGLALTGRFIIPRLEPGLTNRMPRVEVSRHGR